VLRVGDWAFMPGVAVLEPARMAQGLSAFGRLPAHLHSYRNVFNNSVTERTLLRATRSFRRNGNDKPRKNSGLSCAYLGSD
jgi:hypothetical protein